MEGDRPRGEDVSKNTEATPDTGKERGFLKAWLDKIRQSAETTDDEDKPASEARRLRRSAEKEQPEEKEPEGRWERFFKKLFPQVVEKPAHMRLEAPEPVPVFAEALQPDAEPAAQEPEPLNTLELSPAEQIDTDVSELHESDSENLAPEADEEPPHEAEPADDTLEMTTVEEEPTPADEADPVTPEALPLPAVPVSERVVYIRDQQPEPAVSEQKKPQPETVIQRDNRGVALAVGLAGAEFLGRRRADKKIKKDVKELRKESDAQAKSINELRQSREAEQKKAITKAERRRPEQIKRQQNPEQPKVAPAEAVQPEIKSKPQRQVEKAPEMKTSQPQAPEIIHTVRSEVLPQASAEAKAERLREAAPEAPKKILEKVAIAAEHDLPIEKLYERRHEIKDEPTISDAAGAVSVGTVLAQMNVPSETPAAAASTAGSSFAPPSLGSPPAAGGDMYKQAMKSGFWAAIVLLIFAGIAAITL